MSIEHRFAVPIAYARLADCDQLNNDLATLFLARARDEFRNPAQNQARQAEMFESVYNLFSWPEDCVQRLRRFVLEQVVRVAGEASALTPEDMRKLTLHDHTWFHVTHYGGSFFSHNHPLASWSAVYCVRAGETAANHPHSGMLRFFDPRVGADAYVDPANASLRREFALKPIETRLAGGDLVVFPSYLFHEVAPFFGRDVRITVATNCWFVQR
jgi:uncharacterized protein (TIGR02466 family)